MRALSIVLKEGWDAPALVDGSPHDNAWVALVAADSLHPLGGEPLDVFLGELEGVGHLSPYQEAQPVRPVMPTRILDLLVLAGTIEAELFRQLDVSTQVLVGRGGEQPVGEVPLVKH